MNKRLSKPINIINQSEWSKKIVDKISKNKKFEALNIFKKHTFVISMIKIDILETTAILLKLNLQSYNFNLCIIKTISKVNGSGSIQNNS
ncbi:hypothetical protein BHC42_10550 [Snodgrassella alvi]|nr:hypothetical protein BHC42_10550 [Snodgrassella alvi]